MRKKIERYMIWNEKEKPREINFNFTLVIPDGWEFICRHMDVGIDKRTITPVEGQDFAFGLRRKSNGTNALTDQPQPAPDALREALDRADIAERFHAVAVAQRNQAWFEIEQLKKALAAAQEGEK